MTEEDRVIHLKEVLKVKKLWSSTEIDKVELRPALARDLFGLNFSDPTKSNENMTELISRLSGIDFDTIAELPLEDFTVITHRVNKLILEATNAHTV